MKKVMFAGEECIVRESRYADGSRAILLDVAETGEQMCVATLNVGRKFTHNEVAIKDYSENEGVLDVLVEAKVVSQPMYMLPMGYILVPVCNFLGVE